MTTTLYEISNRYLAVLDMATDPDNDIDIGDTLDAIEGEFKEKALAVAGYFQSLDAQIAAMKEAEKRIAERRKAAENHSKRLRAYLQDRMETSGIDKIECPYFVASLAKCPPSVDVYDEGKIPDEFWREKVVREVDKALIKEVGGVPGARLVTDKRILRIR